MLTPERLQGPPGEPNQARPLWLCPSVSAPPSRPDISRGRAADTSAAAVVASTGPMQVLHFRGIPCPWRHGDKGGRHLRETHVLYRKFEKSSTNRSFREPPFRPWLGGPRAPYPASARRLLPGRRPSEA